jgi:hypothetical protein
LQVFLFLIFSGFEQHDEQGVHPRI